MSGDGAHLGVGAERALKTILGGEPAPTEAEQEDIETMRARILSAPIEAVSYDGTATACARLILEAWKRWPQLAEVPTQSVYLESPDGKMEWIGGDAVVLVPGLHAALKQCYRDRPEALAVLSDLTGFMWGWACNAALRCVDLPPEPNPALVTIG